MTDQPGAVTVSGPHRPYADYLEREYGDTYSWLAKFLRNEQKLETFLYESQCMQVHILDSCNGSFQRHDFRAAQSDEVDQAFMSVLSSHPAGSIARYVLVYAAQLGAVNGAFIDAIAWQYKLDPLFLCKHLHNFPFWSTEGRKKKPFSLPSPLPSEDSYISIVGNSADYFTAAVLGKAERSISKYNVKLQRMLPPCKLTLPPSGYTRL